LKASIDGETTINIIVAGDFNLILHANEKRGGCFFPDPFRGRLEAIIQEHEFVDVVPKNCRYTWSNRRIGSSNIMERLDRFLINVSFLSSFSVGYANILPSSASDHYPIMLTLETHYSLGPISFKYSSLWSCDSAVRDIIQRSWNQHVEGSPGFISETKLKRTRQAIKEWERANYKEPEEIKKS